MFNVGLCDYTLSLQKRRDPPIKFGWKIKAVDMVFTNETTPLEARSYCVAWTGLKLRIFLPPPLR